MKAYIHVYIFILKKIL
ncbi:hypothetical protein QL759_001855 [Campylobacter jejuni]|nr:hypothetical protein [Campylobacter jejuni]EJE1746503.1 hypothetical protein [Campylobacter coli]HEE9520319.1 hypothetical protein [Campylobacter jejuni subsp. jejuni]EHL2999808.1 hypothetical protein [Campylobacter jejuni]EHM4274597.1 hypothetical protein [Campylobacter jejuni]